LGTWENRQSGQHNHALGTKIKKKKMLRKTNTSQCSGLSKANEPEQKGIKTLIVQQPGSTRGTEGAARGSQQEENSPTTGMTVAENKEGETGRNKRGGRRGKRFTFTAFFGKKGNRGFDWNRQEKRYLNVIRPLCKTGDAKGERGAQTKLNP